MSPFYGLFERLLASILVLGALVGVAGGALAWSVRIPRSLGLLATALLYAVVVAFLWVEKDWLPVAGTVWLTLVAVVTGGSLLGSMMPLAMARVGVDPAITSSPLVTCLVDILGILIYVLVAGAVLGI